VSLIKVEQKSMQENRKFTKKIKRANHKI